MWKIQLVKLNYDEREAQGAWITMGKKVKQFKDNFSMMLGNDLIRRKGYENILKKMAVCFVFSSFFPFSLQAQTPPLAPSNLVLTPKSTTSVEIKWQDNSGNETGFKIFRDGNLITTTEANVSSYIDEGLTLNTTYMYMVKATDDATVSTIQGVDLTSENDLFGITIKDDWSVAGEGVLIYNNSEDAFEIKTTGGTTNIDGWRNAMYSPTVHLQGGHQYELIVRIKTDVFPRGQNIIVKVMGPSFDSNRNQEYAWNVSKVNEWEEVILPAYPSADGDWKVAIWTYPIKYAQTDSTIFVKVDIDAFELPIGRELASTHDINIEEDKITFESSTHKVDAWGNFYVKQDDETWSHIFPKMMYKGLGENYSELFARYKDYNFNGVMDIWTAEQAQAALDAGLTNISINSNSGVESLETMIRYIDEVYNWAEDNNYHSNIIWYNIDNENAMVSNYEYQEQMAAYVDTNHLDPLTSKRRHPIYYLNGQIGLARTYYNYSRSVMDITGSYVGTYSVGGLSAIALPTLLTQFLNQNQKAPTTVIQLQSYLHEKFIPSLFYGIIQGGRALCVWRDGTVYEGSQIDFRDNIWASTFKNEVSPRLDQLMPIIEQPHFTSWTATTNKFPYIHVGTREFNGFGYLILSNFEDEDSLVRVMLHDFTASKAVDFFTGEHISDINDSSFEFILGHHNGGYKVIKLLQ